MLRVGHMGRDVVHAYEVRGVLWGGIIDFRVDVGGKAIAVTVEIEFFAFFDYPLNLGILQHLSDGLTDA